MSFPIYLRFNRAVGKSGPPVAPLRVEHDPKGPSAARAFKAFDAHGKAPTTCRQPRALQAAMRGKASLNFHVTDVWGPSLRMFARDGFLDVVRAQTSELREAFPWLPAWVWKALEKQARVR